MNPPRSNLIIVLAVALAFLFAAPPNGHTTLSQPQSQPQRPSPSAHSIVLRAARLLDVESGRITTPGEILIEGDVIKEVGAKVTRPAGTEIIDLGDTTLLPA